ncbi:hypothetical protein GNI_031540 [Gregarina niphandrodes]|uniref:Transmembrane protein n=1 Tax=Gregarina niphandrodes TaxID=110365 RepID=A0A023BB89_GRENI|nr:hypothetical protein GNI_031540 [Gregarina niphandrodes]EZG78862.1 hypothetical protein GNI_031540 [Gregarina niphandrodes]|eukprot:XP_011129170.1 hypothetical protein GNI_031540 [Gregarina niphandrodes]
MRRLLFWLIPVASYSSQNDSQTIQPNSSVSGQSFLRGTKINTGGAPTVAIYNGPNGSTDQPAQGKPESSKEEVSDLTASVLKGASENNKESEKSKGQTELMQLEMDQKSANESGHIAEGTDKTAATLEDESQKDAEAVDQEEKRHGNVMESIEENQENEENTFADEEREKRKQIYKDEQELTHDVAAVKEGAQMLKDESRLNADELLTEKAKEESELQGIRRKNREEDEAINLGHDEMEAAETAKKLLAQRSGDDIAKAEECKEPAEKTPPLIAPVESIPCR